MTPTLNPPRFRGAPPTSEHPILFSSPMVRAILEGRKTMTRRIVKPQPKHRLIKATNSRWYDADCVNPGVEVKCPYEGRLCVRETFSISGNGYFYRADVKQPETVKYSWKPSILMPRAASRITLEITGVKAERLQSMSSMDYIQEGIQSSPAKHWYHAPDAREKFEKLWDSLNAKRGFGWRENPWVWVISFRKL